MQAESLWRLRSCTRLASYVGLRTLFAIWTFGCLTWSGGCTVRGFEKIPDGPTTPSQLRAGAAVSRAEANALDEIADQQEGVIRQLTASAQQVAEGFGAPAVLSGLLGAGAGFIVPSPGQRRRERVAAAEAKADAGGV